MARRLTKGQERKKVVIYAEGGGNRALNSTATKVFSEIFGSFPQLEDKLPKVNFMGGRDQAYKAFCRAIAEDKEDSKIILLLVDSEEEVKELYQKGDDRTKWKPWGHLKQRKGDGWVKPSQVSESQCHLMVQCTENWLLVDIDKLKAFLGGQFDEDKIHKAPHVRQGDIERVSKKKLHVALEKATINCGNQFNSDSKGSFTFDALARMDPQDIFDASPWFARLIEELEHCNP